MNSTCTDITASLQDNFLEEFGKTEREEQEKTLRESIDGLSKDFLLTSKEPYEYILTLSNELEISDYISLLRKRAGELKCKGDFDSRVKPYRDKALKDIKQAEQEKAYEEYLKRAESFPDWWDGKTIDEDIFCKRCTPHF